MPRYRLWWTLATALMMLLTVAGASHAQMGGGHGGRQRSQQPAPQPQPSTAPTPSKLMPEIWPRLDIGAILCKSRDDLVRYQMTVSYTHLTLPTIYSV